MAEVGRASRRRFSEELSGREVRRVYRALTGAQRCLRSGERAIVFGWPRLSLRGTALREPAMPTGLLEPRSQHAQLPQLPRDSVQTSPSICAYRNCETFRAPRAAKVTYVAGVSIIGSWTCTSPSGSASRNCQSSPPRTTGAHFRQLKKLLGCRTSKSFTGLPLLAWTNAERAQNLPTFVGCRSPL